MVATMQKSFQWSSIALVLSYVSLMATSLAAAPASPNSEDQPRPYYRSQESYSSPEDNGIPITLDGGAQQAMLYDTNLLHVPPPMENAILNYLLAKRLNRLRSFRNGFDQSSNEISRKRSYSKYCAFNAVSCFGK